MYGLLASYGLVNEAIYGSGDMRRLANEDLVERPNEVREVITQDPNRKSHDVFPVFQRFSHVIIIIFYIFYAF